MTDLAHRYSDEDLAFFDPDERSRFATLPTDRLAWEFLYRKEPELYERLIAGERLHPDVVAWLPSASRVVEVAAGTGRLTAHLVERSDELIVIEPAAPLRAILRERFGERVDVRRGFFDALDVEDGWADMAVSCSALAPDPAHGGDAGLAEMERVTKRYGLIVLVWPPADVDWLRGHGFNYVAFDGEMAVEFGSLDEAIELARVFYPDAVDEIERRASARVPYDLLGMNPPRDIAWKVVE